MHTHTPLPVVRLRTLAARGFALVGAAAALLFAKGAASADSPPEPALTLCLALAPDDSPVMQVAEVSASFRGFAVACRLREADKVSMLAATWTAVDVGDTAPPNTVISSASLPLAARRHGGFRFTLPRDLPVGTYRVDVQADGKEWASIQVPVVADKAASLPAGPADLVPLSQGNTWTYAFRMATGSSGMTLTLPGAERDADGTLRATGTYTVAKPEDAGAHVEIRRGKDLVLEEWWAADEKGVAVTKRRAGDDVMTFDPPQPFFPWPAKGTTASTWTAKGGEPGSAQRVQTWGPVTIEAPAGPAPGWVVLVSLPADAPTLTIERQFVPGTGMVREILVRTLNGEMVTRQESVLTATKFESVTR